MVITESYSFDKYMVQEHGILYIGVLTEKNIHLFWRLQALCTPRVERTLLKAEG